MRSGELNRQITILQKTIAVDADGYPQETWTALGTIWAQAITSGGGEFFSAQRNNAETSTLFKARYTRKVNTFQRVLYNGRTYEILNVADPDGRRESIHISAKEVTTVGKV